MNDEQLHRLARRRAAAKLGFLIHLSVFVLVNGGLYVVNRVTTPDLPWSLWPLGGWGLGLAIHGLAVLLAPALGAMKARMTEEELRRLKSRPPGEI